MTFRQKTVAIFASFAVLVLFLWLFLKPDIFAYKDDLIYYTVRHLYLVGSSMFWACSIGIPMGIILSRPLFIKYAEKIIQIFNVGNAIPTMAVLALALVVLGIGDGPAVVALIMASLLPIVRNTFEGLRSVSSALSEAAKGVGMTAWQRLFLVEFPNSLPILLGGVRTALAINVGTAPLSFIIGGDSLGGLIFPGIYLNNSGQLILGAVSTALLAFLLDAVVATVGCLILRKRGLL